MASYESEHNIKPGAAGQATPARRRPDLSTFLSSFNHIDTSSTRNTNAAATPGDIAAVVRNAAEWYAALEREGGGAEAGREGEGQGVLPQLINELWAEYENPPTQVKGVSEEFIANLDRIPKKSLSSSDTCPICNMPFLEDPYPLVVRLPCHKTHMFDLECLQPWVKMHNSCPLDRKELERKIEPPAPADDDEDEEYDDMYA